MTAQAPAEQAAEDDRFIADVRRQAAYEADRFPHDDWPPIVLALLQRLDQMTARAGVAEATVQRVRDLHYRCGADGPDRLLVGDGYCHECVLAWPCPTITALAAPAQMPTVRPEGSK